MRGWLIQAALMTAGWIVVFRFRKPALQTFKAVSTAKIYSLAEWRSRR